MQTGHALGRAGIVIHVIRSFALELLPPGIASERNLALLSDLLRVDYTIHDTSALRLKLLANDFSWQVLVDFASSHGVLAPFVLALKQRSLLVPLPRSVRRANIEGHVSSRLEEAYAQHLGRRNELREQLSEALAALNLHNVVPLLLKGARYLTEGCAPWSEARGMRDLDILVRQEDAQPAIEALRSIGYGSDSNPSSTDHHLPEMRKSSRYFPVELHTQALSFAARKLLATEHLWAVSSAGRLAEHAFRVLPDEWQMVHALLHHQVSDRGYARRILAIKDLWEFSRLGYALPPQSWRAIAAHMDQGGGSDFLGSWIVQAGRLFGLAAPAGVAISDIARGHADATFRRARSQYWLRRILFVGDKLRFAFSPETLAVRYRLREGDWNAVAMARHVGFLLRLYRGHSFRRLFGQRDRMS